MIKNASCVLLELAEIRGNSPQDSDAAGRRNVLSHKNIILLLASFLVDIEYKVKILFFKFKYRIGSRRDQNLDVISSSPLFDADWYQKTYPDIAANNVDPAEHYLAHGAAEGRNPGPDFDTKDYLQLNQDVAASRVNPLLHFELYGRKEGRKYKSDPVPQSDHQIVAVPPRRKSVDDILYDRFPGLRPLPIFSVPKGKRRVTIVTDSINAGSLFGGVGTALVFGALMARHLDAQLRIATRTEPPDGRSFAAVLEINKISWNDNVDFSFIPHDGSISLAAAEDDIYLTTSWWTTQSVRQTVKHEQIIYLLQEDERMFYGEGDERLRCSNVLKDPNLKFVVNTELLYRHLVSGSEPLPNLLDNGKWFEPAFPSISALPRAPKPRRQFFFYARPHNLRNLYYLGLEVLRECIADGVLDPAEWDFHFAGKDLIDMELAEGVVPQLHQNMPWDEYVELVQKMDVGLSLMSTPHPSYPPMDLVMAGAMVVTNTYGNKTRLDMYSPNIICAEPTVMALKQAVAKAVTLSVVDRLDHEVTATKLSKDWPSAFEPILSSLFGERKSV